ncbi:MAG: helix-turn-helix domain-containing protein [Chloroflexota bacterium]
MPKSQAGSKFFHDGIPVSRHSIAQIAKKDAMDEGLLTDAKVVQILAISKSTLRRWRESGLLTAKKVGKSWLYTQESVARALMEGHPDSTRH